LLPGYPNVSGTRGYPRKSLVMAVSAVVKVVVVEVVIIIIIMSNKTSMVHSGTVNRCLSLWCTHLIQDSHILFYLVAVGAMFRVQLSTGSTHYSIPVIHWSFSQHILSQLIICTPHPVFRNLQRTSSI